MYPFIESHRKITLVKTPVTNSSWASATSHCLLPLLRDKAWFPYDPWRTLPIIFILPTIANDCNDLSHREILTKAVNDLLRLLF